MARMEGPLITADMVRMILDPTHATLKRTGAWLTLDGGVWTVSVAGGTAGGEVHVLTVSTVMELSVREMDLTVSYDETADRLNRMFPNNKT